MKSVISTQQLPQCPVCNLQPVPQSTQHLFLLLAQIALLFVNFKFSIIILMFGYSFPKTVWKCPFCSRQIQQVSNNNQIENNIILRLGNCMALFSLSKFRIFASGIIIACLYFYIQQPKYKPHVTVENIWENLIINCGYEAYMQNSVRANHFYNLYSQNGHIWQFQSIFLQKIPSPYAQYQYLLVKMDPTQFKQQNAFDIKIFTKLAKNLQFKKGDILKIKGQWQGRQDFHLIFIPTDIKDTGKTKQLKEIKYFYRENSMLRSHLQSVKEIYEQKDNQKIVPNKYTK